jgi:very-short-patch-repair endonuclease
MAAILACRRHPGDDRAAGGAQLVLDYWGAALSHVSAAHLWGLLSGRGGSVAPETPVDVSVSGRGGKAGRRGVRLHRSVTLRPNHVTLREGVPVTTPARTIADLGRSVGRSARLLAGRDLRRAIRQAEVLGLPIGTGVGDRTRSDLEADFLALCRRHGMLAPEVNVPIGPHLVDFLWRESRVIVETDSYLYHRGRVAFQDDRGRDLDLRARRFDVVRIAEKQLEEEPDRVATIVRHALRVGADAAESA